MSWEWVVVIAFLPFGCWSGWVIGTELRRRYERKYGRDN